MFKSVCCKELTLNLFLNPEDSLKLTSLKQWAGNLTWVIWQIFNRIVPRWTEWVAMLQAFSLKSSFNNFWLMNKFLPSHSIHYESNRMYVGNSQTSSLWYRWILSEHVNEIFLSLQLILPEPWHLDNSSIVLWSSTVDHISMLYCNVICYTVHIISDVQYRIHSGGCWEITTDYSPFRWATVHTFQHLCLIMFFFSH